MESDQRDSAASWPATPSSDRRQALKRNTRELAIDARAPAACPWREGGKTRNMHLGSSRKIDGEAARQSMWW
jgi:hypothetical protein